MRRPDGLDPRILPETEFCGDPSKPCSRQKGEPEDQVEIDNQG